jgi:hypothetical protein
MNIENTFGIRSSTKTYSRLRNKHRGTLLIFEKKNEGKKMKNYCNALFDVKMKNPDVKIFRRVGYVYSRGYVYSGV